MRKSSGVRGSPPKTGESGGGVSPPKTASRAWQGAGVSPPKPTPGTGQTGEEVGVGVVLASPSTPILTGVSRICTMKLTRIVLEVPCCRCWKREFSWTLDKPFSLIRTAPM